MSTVKLYFKCCRGDTNLPTAFFQTAQQVKMSLISRPPPITPFSIPPSTSSVYFRRQLRLWRRHVSEGGRVGTTKKRMRNKKRENWPEKGIQVKQMDAINFTTLNIRNANSNYNYCLILENVHNFKNHHYKYLHLWQSALSPKLLSCMIDEDDMRVDTFSSQDIFAVCVLFRVYEPPGPAVCYQW